jgi:hypothetical protein
VKGPAADMLHRLRGGTGAEQVASCYLGLIDALVFDEADADDSDGVAALGVRPLVTSTLMSDRAAARRLAEASLEASAVTR